MAQTIEGVNFSKEALTDQRRYGMLKGLIRKSMPIGIRTIFLRVSQSGGAHKRITINFTPSGAKFINPYTFMGILFHMPQVNAISSLDPTLHQPINIANIAADTEFIITAIHVSYNERNPDFHMGKV